MADKLPTSAQGVIKQFLDQYGLGALQNQLWSFAQKEGTADPHVMMNWLDQQPLFHTRFPAIKAMRAQGKPVPSPAQILEYETTALQIARNYGIEDATMGMGPSGSGNRDRTVIQNLLANDVSPAELEDRIKAGYARVAAAPPAVRTAFRSMFGTEGDKELAKFFLDPKAQRDQLLQKANAADIMGSAKDMGFNVSQQVAQAAWHTGSRTEDSVTDALNQAAQLRHLGTNLVGETQVDAGGASGTNQEGQLISAVLGDGNAAAVVERRRQGRVNALTGSAGAGVNEAGSTIGVAE